MNTRTPNPTYLSAAAAAAVLVAVFVVAVPSRGAILGETATTRTVAMILISGGNAYMMWALRRLLRSFGYTGIDRLLEIFVSAILVDLAFNLVETASGGPGFALYRFPLGFYTIVFGYPIIAAFVLGVLSIALGYGLLRLPGPLYDLSEPYAFTQIAAGALLASTRLAHLAPIPSAVGHFILVVLFLSAARDPRATRAHAESTHEVLPRGREEVPSTLEQLRAFFSAHPGASFVAMALILVGLVRNIGLGSGSFDEDARRNLAQAVTAEEAYSINHATYVSCRNEGCEKTLSFTSFKRSSPEIEITVQARGSSFVATARHSRGRTNWSWDESGLQEVCDDPSAADLSARTMLETVVAIEEDERRKNGKYAYKPDFTPPETMSLRTSVQDGEFRATAKHSQGCIRWFWSSEDKQMKSRASTRDSFWKW